MSEQNNPDDRLIKPLWEQLNSPYKEAWKGMSDVDVSSMRAINYWKSELPEDSVVPFIANRRIHGNSKIILQGIPDKSVDLVLADPPYNFTTTDIWFFSNQFDRISKHGHIVFYPPENWWLPFPDQNLFWIKPISTKNTSKHYSRFVEMIGVYGEVKFNPGRHWSQYTNVFTDLVDDATLHAFRKPPSLIERLILNHTDPGDIILDPFAGSFVVADVAERLGRKHISIEIDKDLYERYGHGNNV